MDTEIVRDEMSVIQQTMKDKDAELEMKAVAVKQLQEENQMLTSQMEKMEHETTAKIEVVFMVILYLGSISRKYYEDSYFVKCYL